MLYSITKEQILETNDDIINLQRDIMRYYLIYIEIRIYIRL